VVTTSYVDICPTGFTTITKTYTTVYCPSATTTPPVPEGWKTVVTICTHCAAKPTTVTLTLPQPGSAVETAAYVAPQHPNPIEAAYVTPQYSNSVVTFVTSAKAVTHTIVPLPPVPVCSGSNCPAGYSAPAKNTSSTNIASTSATSPYSTSSIKPFTGAAAKLGSSGFGIVVIVVAGFMLAL